MLVLPTSFNLAPYQLSFFKRPKSLKRPLSTALNAIFPSSRFVYPLSDFFTVPFAFPLNDLPSDSSPSKIFMSVPPLQTSFNYCQPLEAPFNLLPYQEPSLKRHKRPLSTASNATFPAATPLVYRLSDFLRIPFAFSLNEFRSSRRLGVESEERTQKKRQKRADSSRGRSALTGSTGSYSSAPPGRLSFSREDRDLDPIRSDPIRFGRSYVFLPSANHLFVPPSLATRPRFDTPQRSRSNRALRYCRYCASNPHGKRSRQFWSVSKTILLGSCWSVRFWSDF